MTFTIEQFNLDLAVFDPLTTIKHQPDHRTIIATHNEVDPSGDHTFEADTDCCLAVVCYRGSSTVDRGLNSLVIGGQSFTKIADHVQAANETYIEVWRLMSSEIDAATDSRANLTQTAQATYAATAASHTSTVSLHNFKGVDQTSPVGTIVKAQANSQPPWGVDEIPSVLGSLPLMALVVRRGTDPDIEVSPAGDQAAIINYLNDGAGTPNRLLQACVLKEADPPDVDIAVTSESSATSEWAAIGFALQAAVDPMLAGTLSVSSVTGSSVSLSWTAVDNKPDGDVTSQLQRRPAGGGEWIDVGDPVISADGSGSGDITELDEGEEGEARVIQTGSDGQERITNEIEWQAGFIVRKTPTLNGVPGSDATDGAVATSVTATVTIAPGTNRVLFIAAQKAVDDEEGMTVTVDGGDALTPDHVRTAAGVRIHTYLMPVPDGLAPGEYDVVLSVNVGRILTLFAACFNDWDSDTLADFIVETGDDDSPSIDANLPIGTLVGHVATGIDVTATLDTSGGAAEIGNIIGDNGAGLFRRHASAYIQQDGEAGSLEWTLSGAPGAIGWAAIGVVLLGVEAEGDAGGRGMASRSAAQQASRPASWRFNQ